MEYAQTRLNMQLIQEEISNCVYQYHIGLENPEYMAVDYPPEVMATFEQAAKALGIACTYLKRIDLLIDGTESDELYLKRLKEDLEYYDSEPTIEILEGRNASLVREILEAEIESLTNRLEAAEARAALLEEIPMVHARINVA